MSISLTQDQIAEALQTLGLLAGATVFVHSSMSSMGYVQGGADAVVEAFLHVLGPAGTLVVPTFTFAHGRSGSPELDLSPRSLGNGPLHRGYADAAGSAAGVAICSTP